MRPPSPQLAPDQRRQELAKILARGVLRLHGGATSTPPADPPLGPQNPANSAVNCLEVPGYVRLTVHTS